MASAGIVLSGTRAALAGLIVGSAVLVFQLPIFRARRYLAAAALFSGVIIVLYFSPAGAGLRSRMHWSIEEPLGGARPLLWQDSLRMISHRPVAGYGPETFVTEFPRYESAPLARLFPDFQHESPHNVFLDVLTAQGIPGLCIFAATIVLALRIGLLAKNGSAATGPLSAALAGGIAAQQFNSLTVPTALCLYLTVALLVSTDAASNKIAVVIGQKLRWARVLASLFAIAFVWYAIRLAIADRELALTRTALGRSELRQALSHYEIAQRWHPSGSSADLYFSRELANFFRQTPDVRLKLQTWTPAFQAAARAASTAENRQDAFYNLAIFFATQNDGANVERSLGDAIAWAPNWFKPHWTLAKLFLIENRLSDAEAQARLALDLDAGKDPEIKLTLDAIVARAVEKH
jgi:hypothetical protein